VNLGDANVRPHIESTHVTPTMVQSVQGTPVCPECGNLITEKNKMLSCEHCKKRFCEICERRIKKHENYENYVFQFEWPLCKECYTTRYMRQLNRLEICPNCGKVITLDNHLCLCKRCGKKFCQLCEENIVKSDSYHISELSMDVPLHHETPLCKKCYEISHQYQIELITLCPECYSTLQYFSEKVLAITSQRSLTKASRLGLFFERKVNKRIGSRLRQLFDREIIVESIRSFLLDGGACENGHLFYAKTIDRGWSYKCPRCARIMKIGTRYQKERKGIFACPHGCRGLFCLEQAVTQTTEAMLQGKARKLPWVDDLQEKIDFKMQDYCKKRLCDKTAIPCLPKSLYQCAQ